MLQDDQEGTDRPRAVEEGEPRQRPGDRLGPRSCGRQTGWQVLFVADGVVFAQLPARQSALVPHTVPTAPRQTPFVVAVPGVLVVAQIAVPPV